MTGLFHAPPRRKMAALPVEPSPVGWWMLEEGAGDIAADSSGSGNDGTISSGAEWVAGAGGSSVWAIHLQAFSQRFIDMGDAAELSVESDEVFSACMYVLAFSTQSAGIPIFTKRAATWMGWVLQLRSAGAGGVTKFGGVVEDGGTTRISQTSVVNFPFGEWHHVGFTYDGSRIASGMKLYLDGSEVAADTESDNLGSGTIKSSAPVRVGADWNVNPVSTLDGYADDVRFFRSELTAQEMSDIAANPR